MLAVTLSAHGHGRLDPRRCVRPHLRIAGHLRDSGAASLCNGESLRRVIPVRHAFAARDALLPFLKEKHGARGES